MQPYFSDDTVTLYAGDCREILPALSLTADLLVADPPYGETAIAWDQWPDGWLAVAAAATHSLWCFGSMRMFLLHGMEFATAGWKLSQDIVWEKPRGTSFVADRFSRVHEHALHWYQGAWNELHHETPRDQHHGKRISLPVRKGKDEYLHGAIGQSVSWEDNGTRLARSVMAIQGVRRGQATGSHPTEKPLGILDPLISYACPPGGLVVDPFAGSGSTLDAARQSGRRAIGIEANEAYAEKAARRLEQLTLEAS